MSRIGRHPIAIPAGVTVEIAENNVVTVKGPKGNISSNTAFNDDQTLALLQSILNSKT